MQAALCPIGLRRAYLSNIMNFMRWQNLKYLTPKCVLFILAFVLVYIVSTLIDIYLFSTVNQLKKSDAAVVLGASAWHERPSPVFRERINHGIWL
jgi:vancomycin permeability regulator SanA